MATMTDAQLREFLLRRLASDEVARIEEAIVLQEGFAERLREAEFDLLDDYALSRLSAEDATAVEQHLLGSQENRHSVRIARALRHPSTPSEPRGSRESGSPPPPTSLPPASPVTAPLRGRLPFRRSVSKAFAATLVAACVIGIAVVPRWRFVPQPVESRPPILGSQATQAPGSGAANALRVVSLLADVNRGDARRRIRIEVGAAAVRLQAEVPAAMPESAYALDIEDARGRQLFRASALVVHAAGPYRFVEAVVPAATLAPGDRTVVLSKVSEPVGSVVTFRWQMTGVSAPSFFRDRP